MFEVLVTLAKTDTGAYEIEKIEKTGMPIPYKIENRLKAFPTFAEARLWAINRAKRSFPDACISIYYRAPNAPSELMETFEP